MKKIYFASILLAFIIIFSVTVYAEPESTIADPEYSGLFSDLPENISGRLPDSVNGTDIESDAAALTSWDFILGALSAITSDQFAKILPMLCRLLGLILISSAVNTFCVSLEPKTAKVLALCSSCAVSVAFIALQIDTVRATAEYLKDLTALANGMSPVIIALYASGGNVASATVSGSALSVFLAFSENMLSRSIIPFAGTCLCLLSVSSVSAQVGLDRLLELIRKTYVSFLTFVMTLFCAVLGMQSIIAKGNDSVSLRAVRFVVGSAIPVVGGSVGESIKSLASGLGLIKKCFGATGIVLISLLTLPTLLLLLLTRFALNLTASAAAILGCSDERRLLDGISSVYGSLVAVVSACSLMFVFLLIMLAGSVTALNV